MPSLNQVAYISAAVQSVLSQSYFHVELIVADGGSVDGTQAWLALQQSNDGRLRWFSEPDSGPAEALNKALRLARGTILGWLNSDDLYTSGAVQRAVQKLLAHKEWLMVYGHGQHIDSEGNALDWYPTLTPSDSEANFSNGCYICQPTVFFKRTMSLMLGPLDQSLKTAFDFDYWLRAFGAFPGRVGFVDALQAQSRLHVGCITLRLRRTVILEGMQLLARHLGHAPRQWLLTYLVELLAKPIDERGVENLSEHVMQTLEMAKPWLLASDFRALEVEIAILLK